MIAALILVGPALLLVGGGVLGEWLWEKWDERRVR